MNNPLTAVLDGLSIAGLHWQLVSGILLVLLASQFVMYFLLRGIFGDKFTAGEYYSLSLAGWLLPASLISLLWYAGAAVLSTQLGIPVMAVFIVLISIALYVHIPKEATSASKAAALSLLILTGLFITLRLAFVSGAILPLYFDSAQHHRFISGILSDLDEPGTMTWSLAAYYHMGFHFLAAFISSITRAGITDTMLVLGQIILGTMPFPFFFIVRHGTRSNSAGLFALVLAAFGWYMPAHAVDWGKYPALASLALVPFVVSAAYLLIQNKGMAPVRKYWSLIALLLAGAAVSVLLHSRSTIMFGILVLTWLMTSAWKKLPKLQQFLFLGLVILVVIGEIVFIHTKGILGPLFDPYGMKAVFITASVLFLSVFAWLAYPRLVFSCLVSTSLLLASLFIPLVDLVPGYATTTLLDRPYVEMILYMPLALLGGFGLAGFEQRLQGKSMVWRDTRLPVSKIMGGFFITLVAVNALFKYDLYPSDCCDIASEDDLAAIHWLDENLPVDALILTASTELNVLPTDEFQGSAGGDAGTWITPLTGRAVTSLPFHTDFSQRQTLDTLCQLQVDYVYVGKTGWYFDDSGMPVQPDGYRILFALPNARVYEVIGCE